MRAELRLEESSSSREQLHHYQVLLPHPPLHSLSLAAQTFVLLDTRSAHGRHRRRKKERRQQTREDQLYGVFAGSSDEEEGGGGRRGRKRKASEADYSQPVAFVSTGETMGGTARPPQHANDGNQQPGASRGGLGSSGAAAEPSASGWVGAGGAFTAARGDLGNGDVDGGRGGLGLGASDSPGPGSRSGLGSGGGGGDGLGRQQPGVGSGGGGPGFRSAGQQVGAAEDEDDEDDVFLPTSFGKR
jgi:hypothetical protein